jgi:hypothetical protein
LSHLARIRQQQQSRGRRALGLFVAVWLNLALQPCAMALQSEDNYNCLHCPPAQAQAQAQAHEHEHGGMHGDMDHEMRCADDLSDCVLVQDLNHDGRSGQFKLKDAPSDIAVAVAPHELAVQFQRPADTPLRPRYTSVPAGAPPPLHVLYCVYLD